MSDEEGEEASFATQLAQSGAHMYGEGYSPQDATLGGKLCVLEGLLKQGKALAPAERWVVISNFTATLDLIGTLCQQWGHTTLRLDGSTPSHERNSLVERFNSNGGARRNSGSPGFFIFLLSAKAGGVGLNLIGANRLVLLDPDWNPATDMQAMARVWRDGQTKPVVIYRMFSTGTIEEKILQRQMTKGELADGVSNGASGGGSSGGAKKKTSKKGQFTRDELKDLFSMPSEVDACETALRVRSKHGALAGSTTAWSEQYEDVVASSVADKLIQAVVSMRSTTFSLRSTNLGLFRTECGLCWAESGLVWTAFDIFWAEF